MAKKIILHTNNPKMATGLAENGRALMKYLLSKRDKYELIYYCSQTSIADPILSMMPCKAYGCIPNDQQIIQQLNNDPIRARDVSYGGYYIDEIIKNEKPDIYLGVDDLWSFGNPSYVDRPWWKKINSILHITIDSRPILEEAFKQAKNTKNYFTWTNFSSIEMQKYGNDYSHVKTIYGAFDIGNFSPITRQEKLDLRKKFGIDPDAIIFFYLSRNQLRKNFPQLIEAFAAFKKDYHNANAKLHFHSSFSEMGAGWNIPKLMAYHKVKKEDVLCTYICKNCGQWHVKPYDGEDIDCMYCGSKKSMITANISNFVPDDEMKYLIGMADASPNCFTSGALERGLPAAMLCRLPVAATNYSAGEDFCKLPFVHKLNFHSYWEAGSNFMKASTDINSIKNFMTLIYKMSNKEKIFIGEKSRQWAINNFSIENIGKQWEQIFDSLTPPDWSSISLEPEPKNPNFILPPNVDEMNDIDFLKMLYKEILKMEVSDNDSGLLYWLGILQPTDVIAGNSQIKKD